MRLRAAAAPPHGRRGCSSAKNPGKLSQTRWGMTLGFSGTRDPFSFSGVPVPGIALGTAVGSSPDQLASVGRPDIGRPLGLLFSVRWDERVVGQEGIVTGIRGLVALGKGLIWVGS